MYSKISSCDDAAITSGVGKASNSAGVIRLTRLSVHCADSITAIRS